MYTVSHPEREHPGLHRQCQGYAQDASDDNTGLAPSGVSAPQFGQYQRYTDSRRRKPAEQPIASYRTRHRARRFCRSDRRAKHDAGYVNVHRPLTRVAKSAVS